MTTKCSKRVRGELDYSIMSDDELRPWVHNQQLQVKLDDEFDQLTTSLSNSPHKLAGYRGHSELDGQVPELVEFLESTTKPYWTDSLALIDTTTEDHTGPLSVDEDVTEMDNSDRGISDDSAKFDNPKIVALKMKLTQSRPKSAQPSRSNKVPSVSYQPRKGPAVLNMSSEKYSTMLAMSGYLDQWCQSSSSPRPSTSNISEKIIQNNEEIGKKSFENYAKSKSRPQTATPSRPQSASSFRSPRSPGSGFPSKNSTITTADIIDIYEINSRIDDSMQQSKHGIAAAPLSSSDINPLLVPPPLQADLSENNRESNFASKINNIRPKSANNLSRNSSRFAAEKLKNMASTFNNLSNNNPDDNSKYHGIDTFQNASNTPSLPNRNPGNSKIINKGFSTNGKLDMKDSARMSNFDDNLCSDGNDSCVNSTRTSISARSNQNDNITGPWNSTLCSVQSAKLFSRPQSASSTTSSSHRNQSSAQSQNRVPSANRPPSGRRNGSKSSSQRSSTAAQSETARKVADVDKRMNSITIDNNESSSSLRKGEWTPAQSIAANSNVDTLSSTRSVPVSPLDRLKVEPQIGSVSKVFYTHRIRDMKSLRDQMLTTAGAYSLAFQPENALNSSNFDCNFDANNEANMKSTRDDLANRSQQKLLATLQSTREMSKAVVEKNKADSTWAVLTTPGYLEAVGESRVFLSECHLRHTNNDEFEEKVCI